MPRTRYIRNGIRYSKLGTDRHHCDFCMRAAAAAHRDSAGALPVQVPLRAVYARTENSSRIVLCREHAQALRTHDETSGAEVTLDVPEIRKGTRRRALRGQMTIDEAAEQA